ncbi:MAG: ComEC/Rec2 family competence protein [Pyramidobacter sp.]|jgi:competence protein ComEC
MDSLLNRIPSLLLFVGTAAAVYLRGAGLPMGLAVFAAFLIVAAQICVGEEKWDLFKFQILLILMALTGLFSWNVSARLARPADLPSAVSGIFTVAERRVVAENSLLLLKDERGRTWLADADGDLEEAREGDRCALEASVAPLRESSLRSTFSPLKYWRSRSVSGQLRRIKAVRPLKPAFSLHTLRQALRERIDRLPPQSRALTAAVLLGDRDANLREDYRRWGISHILAVSGWHVGLAVAAGCLLFGAGRRSVLLCSALLWGYCLLSGAAASALRASLMIQTAMIGLLQGDRANALNSIGVAGIVMLLWNPWTFYDLGWQLSMLAAVVVTALNGCGRDFCALLVCPALWAVSSPIAAPMSGGIFFSALPINMMASAFFAFILCFVLLSAMPSLLGLSAQYFSLPAELLLRFWAKVADQWVEWLPAALPVNSFPLWFCGGLLFFIVSAALKFSIKRRLVLTVIGCLCAALFAAL